jgi:ribonuclease E
MSASADTPSDAPRPDPGVPSDASGDAPSTSPDASAAGADPNRPRRRGNRGGKNRRRPASAGAPLEDGTESIGSDPELPDPPQEGQPRPRVAADRPPKARNPRQPQKSRAGAERAEGTDGAESGEAPTKAASTRANSGGRGRRGAGADGRRADIIEPARDAPRDRNGKPIGRYLMCVHTRPTATQIAVLEGRALIEHFVSRPTDHATQIHGNIYCGRVQNVLPGMEAAFVDIGTPKNAVLYRSDVSVDLGDIEGGSTSSRSRNKQQNASRIEDILRNGQIITCQVTKNPIGAKGARLTQEVSLPGRFVVLIPNSDTYGISKRLGDDERKRLRRILDEVRPEGHGLIVRTAAEGATAEELRADVVELGRLWKEIEAKANRAKGPALLHREPDLAVRVIREEFNRNYRGVILDDPDLFAEVRSYVERITPELADRVEFYDPAKEGLPLFERHHVHEQVHKAIDRKVWLPSGGSLIIERTEALTVIDVNTGKNVGSSNLEETVFRNNLEAADEIARQLRLRDIGGIIVIDFIDMEIRANREAVMNTFRTALGRDKTRSQVFDISELGLVEMTRKRISEGLVESLSGTCPTCNGRGITFDESLIG